MYPSDTRNDNTDAARTAPDTKATYYCNSLDEAKQLVQKQAVHGIVYIPADFDTKLNRGEQAHVGVYCDMSLMLTYKAIYQTAQTVASHINSGIQISKSGGFTDRDDEITTEPLAFDEVPIFNTTAGYGNAILPGVQRVRKSCSSPRSGSTVS